MLAQDNVGSVSRQQSHYRDEGIFITLKCKPPHRRLSPQASDISDQEAYLKGPNSKGGLMTSLPKYSCTCSTKAWSGNHQTGPARMDAQGENR